MMAQPEPISEPISKSISKPISKPIYLIFFWLTLAVGILVEKIFFDSFKVWWWMLLELWPPFQWGFSRMELVLWVLEVLYPFFVIGVSVWGWWMVRRQKYARALLVWLGSSGLVLWGSWWLIN
jgi:hypothetical protein